jgi:protein O-GlcNAc transferase
VLGYYTAMARSVTPRGQSTAFQRALNDAVSAHQRGQLAQAEALYLDVLRLQPGLFEAQHLLGVLRGQQGRLEEALALVGAALKTQPNAPGALANYGLILHRMKRHTEALTSLDASVALKPDNAEALNNRGNVLSGLDRPAEALSSYERALAVRPDYAEAHHNRGLALAVLGRDEEALGSYVRAVQVRPDYAEAHQHRGDALARLGRLDDALTSYARALAITPDRADVLDRRGAVEYTLGQLDAALASYDQALAVDPERPETLYNRGGILQELNRHDQALASFDRAIALRPDYAEALYARGNSLHVMNRCPEAVASYQSALSARPDYPEARFALCMAELPILYERETDIDERRSAYATQLRALSETTKLESDLLDRGVGSRQPFFLTYQGRNDRDLQSTYGAIVCGLMAKRYPPLPLGPRPHADEPVRLGIVSGFFRAHANWNIPIGGWLGQLDRRRFRMFGYYTGAIQDAETQAAAGLCERFVQGPLSTERWREEIAADAPHVLIYPEVGMDAMVTRLAAQRLAHVQCNSWGHPDTSGIPTLDYFLSSALMEPADGDGHYTERLVRLPNLSVYCEPTTPSPMPLRRVELGLREAATVFWCGQSLYKYLPQFDPVFPRIARGLDDCQFVFIGYTRGRWITDLFRARLERAFADCGLRAEDHCVILPQMPRELFIAATGLCDVFLDSIGWSGCNSTLEALAYDLPVVTMPGALMRGRHSAAMLEMMGVTETIAASLETYVAVATRLGREPDWRAHVKRKLGENKHRLYRDRACIAALEDFLDRVARAES